MFLLLIGCTAPDFIDDLIIHMAVDDESVALTAMRNRFGELRSSECRALVEMAPSLDAEAMTVDHQPDCPTSWSLAERPSNASTLHLGEEAIALGALFQDVEALVDDDGWLESGELANVELIAEEPPSAYRLYACEGLSLYSCEDLEVELSQEGSQVSFVVPGDTLGDAVPVLSASYNVDPDCPAVSCSIYATYDLELDLSW